MAISNGSRVQSIDFPATVTNIDDTILTQISSASYIPGSPEVGVYFRAPSSGRVVITIGGGFRDNGSNLTRIFMAPEVFEWDSSHTKVLEPFAETNGIISPAQADAFMYMSRTSILEDLNPGWIYYARLVFYTSNTPASPSADIAAREITVGPA